MCIHSWSKSALLVLMLFLAHSSFAGTKVVVKVPSASSVLSGGGTSVKNGTSSVSVSGPPIQEYIPRTPTGTPGTPIKVIPRYDYSIPRTITQVKSLLSRGGLVGLAGTLALQQLLDGIGGLIDDAGNVSIKGPDTVDGLPYNGNKSIGSDCSSALRNPVGVYGGPQTFIRISTEVPSSPWKYINNCTSRHVSIRTFPSNPVVPSTPVPATVDNLGAVDNVIPSADPDWIRSIASEACQGALNPEACITSLVSSGPNLSGPTAVQGPKTTTTTTGPAGTTTTTTNTNYTVVYGPSNTYTYNTNKTTTVTKPDGTTETSTETSTPDSPDQETPDEQYSFEDAAFPEVKPFYEQKYPDGLQGVWDQKKSQVDSSEFMSFLSGFVPSFSGSCPAFGLSFHIASWANYGNVSFSSLCYVFDFVKVVLLVSALFLCRALTFGG